MAQSLARLWTHLIFSTKDRFPFLTDKVLRREMHGYFAEMLRKHRCETLIIGVSRITRIPCLRFRVQMRLQM